MKKSESMGVLLEKALNTLNLCAHNYYEDGNIKDTKFCIRKILQATDPDSSEVMPPNPKIEHLRPRAQAFSLMGLIEDKEGGGGGGGDRVIKNFCKALEICIEIEDTYGENVVMNNIAMVYFKPRDVTIAIDILEIVLVRLDLYSNQNVLILNNLGALCGENKEYSRAYEFYKACLFYFEILKDKPNILKTMYKMAKMRLMEEKIDEAATILAKMVGIPDKPPVTKEPADYEEEKFYQMKAGMKLGTILQREQEFSIAQSYKYRITRALTYLRESFLIIRKYKAFMEFTGKCLSIIGNVYFLNSEKDKAAKYFIGALKFFHEQKESTPEKRLLNVEKATKGMGDQLFKLGMLNMFIGNYAKAAEYFDSSMKNGGERYMIKVLMRSGRCQYFVGVQENNPTLRAKGLDLFKRGLVLWSHKMIYERERWRKEKKEKESVGFKGSTAFEKGLYYMSRYNYMAASRQFKKSIKMGVDKEKELDCLKKLAKGYYFVGTLEDIQTFIVMGAHVAKKFLDAWAASRVGEIEKSKTVKRENKKEEEDVRKTHFTLPTDRLYRFIRNMNIKQ
jgi:tetratricopeptide (TPR) repeat protein